MRFFLLFVWFFATSICMIQAGDLVKSINQLMENVTGVKNEVATVNQKLDYLKNNLSKKGLPISVPVESESSKCQLSNWEDKKLINFILKWSKNHYVKSSLDAVAIGRGLGYKTANLMELQKLCQDCQAENILFGGIRTQVPTFAGISSDEIINFLKQICDIDINDRWKKFIESVLPSEADKTELYQTQNYPKKFLKTLKSDFEDAIANKIRELKGKLDFDKFKASFPAAVSDLNKLFDEIGENDRIMVRSSGCEDTDELSNAGGNESVSNVCKNVDDILDAIAIVISSYFSAKSMIQRLGANDKGLLNPPFIPVLFQKMVGEIAQKNPSSGRTAEEREKITRCGVMYTEEPEGGIFSFAKKDASNIRTSGITVVQASYGHNEGVVNSIVPVDSFYIDRDIEAHLVIRPKSFRLVPTTIDEQKSSSSKLKRVDNAQAFSDMITLVRGEIESLKFFADLLEAYYQKPMDVEFVIDNKTIYLVQARPIPHGKTETPSYLTIDFDRYKDSIMDVETIVAAGGALKAFWDPNNIIIKENIRQALLEYQDSHRDKKNISCVIVGRDAPATSHEAATFRGECKPVLYCKEFNTCEKFFSGALGFVIDVQQGKIFNQAKAGLGKNNLQEIWADPAIASSGWISYPTPMLISLWSENKINGWKNVPEMESVFGAQIAKDTLETIASHFGTQVEKLNFNLFFQILKSNKTKNLEDVSWALRGILGLFLFWAAKIKNNEVIIINKFVLYYCQKILDLYKKDLQANGAEFRANYLFLLNKLESLIYQQPKLELIRGYSIFQEIKTLQETKTVTSETKGLSSESVLLARLGLHAMTPELKTEWLNFVSEVQALSDVRAKNKLTLLVFKLAALDVAKTWLHTSFVQSRGLDTGTRLDKLFNECFNTISKDKVTLSPFLEKLGNYKKKIDSLNLGGVVDPAIFLKVWEDFYKNILSYFTSEEIRTDFGKSQSNIEKVTALMLVDALIKKFDTSIKDMSNSDRYKIAKVDIEKDIKTVIDSQDKTFIEQEIKGNRNLLFTLSFMLAHYFDLLLNWYAILNAAGFSSELRNYGDVLITQVLSWDEHEIKGASRLPFGGLLREVSKNTSNKKQRDETVGYDVYISKIGSGVPYDKVFPEILSKKPKKQKLTVSLEDLFSTIHQSLLVIIGKLMDKYGPSDEFMPKPMQEVCNNISNFIGDATKLATEQTDNSLKRLAKMASDNKFEIQYSYEHKLYNTAIEITYSKVDNVENIEICVVIFGLGGYACIDILDDMRGILCELYKVSPAAGDVRADRSIEVRWTIRQDFAGLAEKIAKCIFFLSEIERLKKPAEIVTFILDEKLLKFDTSQKQFVTAEYPIKPRSKYIDFSTNEIKSKIIEYSANNSTRICWPLKELVMQEVKYTAFDEENEKILPVNREFNFVSNDIKENLKKIVEKLGNLDTPYAEESGMYLYRQKYSNIFDYFKSEERQKLFEKVKPELQAMIDKIKILLT